MSMKFKKWHEREYTYMPKQVDKHKHNYSVKYILEITNNNIHATGNFYNTKSYYNVLKCDSCDSFIPVSKEGNYAGHIFKKEDIDKSLPLIKANTNYKNPIYTFKDLYDVVVEKKN